MKVSKKIYLIDKALTPLSIVVYFTYKYLFYYFFKLFFAKLNPTPEIIKRRGVNGGITLFNFVFSDLDIGIVCTEQQTESVKIIYYKLKKYFIFLGELEIYTPEEMRSFKETPSQAINLYNEIRKMRQLNWLRSRITNENSRTFYHRIKDIRKFNQLIATTGLTNWNNSIEYTYNLLLTYTKSEFVFSADRYSCNDSIFCSYFFRNFNINEKNKNISLFLLSCFPPAARSNSKLDSIVKEIRFKNPNIEEAFLKLNAIEYFFAKGYIRGTNSAKEWHAQWPLELLSGFKEKRDIPYCLDPFENNRITSEGDVFLCCYQRWQPVGNLLSNTLDEIYDSKIVKEIQSSVMRGEFHKSCQIQACPRTYSERYATFSTDARELISKKRIEIDPPNTHCNIGGKKPTLQEPACIMCERSLEGYRFEKDLSHYFLHKIKADIYNNIHIQGVSEPFFHGLIFDYLDQVNFNKELNCAVTTVSNGIVFDLEKQKRWLSVTNYSFIGFSIDAASSITYKKIRRLDSFDIVLKNIKSYSSLIQNNRENHLFRIQNNINTLNLHEVVEMVEFAKYVEAYEIEFNLTGGYPLDILINKENEEMFKEAQVKIFEISSKINQKVNFTRPFSL